MDGYCTILLANKTEHTYEVTSNGGDGGKNNQMQVSDGTVVFRGSADIASIDAQFLSLSRFIKR